MKMFCRRRCCRNLQNGDITIEELKNKVSQGAILIDVRSNQEYREGHLQGSANIPDFEIPNRIQREIPKKNQLIVVYCQYGGRSKNTKMMMEKMGYTNVYNLYGGLDML
jgi:rhodanese-related sulfurtransferase